jgi:hypothetical protein
MTAYSLQNVEDQLRDDFNEAYKQRLIEYLTNQKRELADLKQKLIPVDEYDRLEYLERSLYAALLTILKYRPIKSKTPENNQADTFNSIFTVNRKEGYQ